MRKVLYLFTLLLLANIVHAQTPVTHGAAGANNQTQNLAGVNVTVTRNGSSVNLGNNTVCNTGPYQVGLNNSGGYRFTFNAPVTHVTLSIVRIHTRDTIAFRVNNNPVVLTTAHIQPYSGSCTLPIANPDQNGNLSSTVVQAPGPAADGAGAKIDFSNWMAPYSVNTLDIETANADNLFGSNGIVFSLEFRANDTCKIPFSIVASDSTPCTGRCITLQVPNFPNSTFSWTKRSTVIGAFPMPGAKIDTFLQRICPVTNQYLGEFIAHAERGSCVFDDTIFLTPSNTPLVPIVSRPLFPSGICRGAEDSLDSKAQGAGGIEYFWYRRNPTANIKGQVPGVVNERFLEIPDFQTSDEGEYCSYVVTPAPDFCVSDTACLNAFMLPDVIAEFEIFQRIMGCEADTVRIQNKSRGATAGYIWRIYNEATPPALITIRNDATEFIEQTYPIPYPNNSPTPRNYVVELVAKNLACRDSVKDSSQFHHPLLAGFKVNKDNVCQGASVDTVFFTDTTTLAVNGLHQYYWEFGEPGSPTSTNDNGLKWLYTKTGTWRAKLRVTDFLGCVDSAWHDIFVDSTGPLFFNTSDTVVCAGQRVLFTGDLNRVGLTKSFWNFGNGLEIADTSSVIFNYDIPGMYNVSFNASYRVCPDAISETRIRVKPFPTINVGPDTSMCQYGQPIRLWDRTNHPQTPGLTWHWNTPSGRENSNTLVVRHPGVYSASVTMDGCTATDSVTVNRNCYLDIPNAFTPDGDGNNDYFLPRQLMGRSVSYFKMLVFNRWGQKVFETTSINGRGWDGNFNAEKQPSGVYVYQLEVGFSDNASRLEKYEGNITLLR
ncbi:MAG: T9SS type B sorting domain-containing protein [Sphingobacteriales bacterium]|nr:MAG: T9SS type B sorting domain-containing protein [Sphingobacteriales bacterium]